MATFVMREQLAAKVGSNEGVSASMADLWNMPLATKREMGNIYTRLTITGKEKSKGRGGWDIVNLNVPDQGEDFLPNFRPGDSIYLYAYTDTPNPTGAILFKGSIVAMSQHSITVHLNDGQQNEHILADSTYAVEHSGSDNTFTANLRSLSELIHAPSDRRQLLRSANPQPTPRDGLPAPTAPPTMTRCSRSSRPTTSSCSWARREPARHRWRCASWSKRHSATPTHRCCSPRTPTER